MPATIRDVAKRAGVSLGTVSNYLNDNKPIAPTTRERIEAAIQDLEFIPNSASRVMRGKRTPAIGFVVPDAANPFFTEIARAVEDEAVDAGLVVVTCNTLGNGDRETRYLRALSEMRVLGVLLTPTQPSFDQALALRRSGAALVLIDQAPTGTTFSSAAVDDLLGGRLAMEHLLGLGHRRVVFAGGPGGQTQVDDRYRGAGQALREAGVDPVVLTRIDAADSTLAARAGVADRILALDPAPTAVFAANDLIALAIQAALTRRGIETPRDLSIVGYDDIDPAQLAAVPLTTVRQPMRELGKEAIQMLLAEARSAAPRSTRHLAFTPELVVRESTGPVPRKIENS